MMEMIQRDERNVLDGMLVAINANDRLNFNMQYNVIPVAAAKNLGMIGMKVFADGAMYSKEATFSRKPEHVIRTIGSDTLPSRQLVQYTLSTPGIGNAIIGTGQIDQDSTSCQLCQNLSAAQIEANGLSISDRRAIETIAGVVKDGKTNYFQISEHQLSAPRSLVATQNVRGKKRGIEIQWQTAYAGDEPLSHYEVWRDHQKVGQVAHQPQVSKKPFVFKDVLSDKTAHTYQIVSADITGRTASRRICRSLLCSITPATYPFVRCWP